jgi:predicted RNase H-like HicB family nuclease
MTRVECRVEFFNEGDKVVALCSDLNLSSFGDTVEQARVRFEEALRLFLEGCEQMGTLEEVLRESGFEQAAGEPERWTPRRMVGQEQLEAALGPR